MHKGGLLACLPIATMVFASIAHASEVLPAETAAYSAKMTIEIDGETIAGRIFHDRGRERHEIEVDGIPQVTILRPDLGIAYVLQGEDAALVELSLEEASPLPPWSELRAAEIELLGSRDIEGEETKHYRVARKAGENGPALDLQIWMTDDGVLARLAGSIDYSDSDTAEIVIERSQINRGPQNPAFFEPPEGAPYRN